MSRIQIIDINCTKEIESFEDQYKFIVKFQCVEDLVDPVEFRVVYVGRAREESYDQMLDRIELDNVRKGTFRFQFDSPPPVVSKIPDDDLLGVTIVMICGYYRNMEFVRIGYYVNVFYDDPELSDNPPFPPQTNRMRRQILMDDVRVTHFAIQWEGDSEQCSDDKTEDYYCQINQYASQLEGRLASAMKRPDLMPPKTGKGNDIPAVFDEDVEMEGGEDEPCLML
ncbi:hypothetical protein ACOME3_004796 [Neoechinorhynchus agilis]